MTQMFADGLVLPAVFLALLGWLVPRGLSLFWPEGVKPLLTLALTATLIMLAVSMVFFVALYVWQGAPLAMLFESGVGAGIVHFARLGLISALLWGPILILSVSGLPKLWVKETW
jgi:hypothetical protein